MTETTPRARAKADRRQALLDSAAALFADRGYPGVSMEELGAAAGVSGPAVYRHFRGKQAVLAELLTGVSAHLLDGGRRVADRAATPADAVRGLIAFHVDFACTSADVIRVQDRDLYSLDPAPRSEVRRLQRRYVEVWTAALGGVVDQPPEERRIRVQAVFGLINSTPHTARPSAHVPDPVLRSLLQRMAWSALTRA